MKKETNRSEKRAWNPILVLALFLCAVFGIVALTYSWLTDSDDAAPTDENTIYEQAHIDDFSYDFEYSFDNVNWEDASSDGLGGIPVDYTNSRAANYIGNLRYRVTQHGSIKSAVRVKFSYQWFNTQTLTTAAVGEEPSTVRNAMQGPAITLTPSLTSDWSSGDNGYYYYQSSSSYVFRQDEEPVIICNGFAPVSVPTGFNAQLRIVALLDGVQFNRYREVWGIDSLT